MAQPSRKKTKGFATNVVELQTAPLAQRHPLEVRTNHDSGSIILDLKQFAEGTLDKTAYPLIQNRFSGRPTLIKQLAPHIQSLYGNKRKISAKNIITILRSWWVFFDTINDEHNVDSFEHIDDFVSFKQLRAKGMGSNNRTDFLRLVNACRTAHGLPALYWPSTDEKESVRSLPHFAHVKLIYHELKQHMKLVMARWDLADELAMSGKDWSGGLAGRHNKIHGYWTDADTHATYRGAIVRLGNPIPTKDQIRILLVRTAVPAVNNLADAVMGLYPRKVDVQYMLFLFLLRTGWNATTALEIDVDTSLVQHPTSDAHHVVRAIKNRGGSEQVAIGLNKSQFSPGNILRVLIARTAPLRSHLRVELAELEKTYGIAGGDDILERIRELRRKIKSPWLYSAKRDSISFLTIFNYLNVSQGKTGCSGLQDIIMKINFTRPESDLIDVGMSVGDFRDAYISFAYESSGYSWLVAKLAAGHRSLESLRTYLRKRHWKAHGEKKVHAWGEALWSEIKVYRSVDPAILYARVQRGEISSEERARWTKRTHVGTGCRDFAHPPQYVAPEHKEGSGCRVQRCTLCHQAIIFDDSYDLLARRLMELAYIRETTPLLAWMQSSFPIEMENTERALSQFDAKTVAERKQFWLDEINSARYTPVTFEGAY